MKRIGLVVSVVSIVVGFSGCSSEAPSPRTAQLGAGIEAAMADGHAPTSVMVYLKGQADLAPAAMMATKQERGASVQKRLLDHAKSSQAPLLEWLAKEHVSAKPFYIVDAVLIHDASPALIRKLSVRNDVEQLIVNKPVALKRVPNDKVGEDAISPNAIGSNITATGAPSVWNQLHHTGEGIVVGGEDTGYDWTHPALKSHYRGWNGTTADHSHSWHDAIHANAGSNSCGHDAKAPCDDNEHGTHTMGTIVGDDGAGNQIGMAPGAKWIGCRNMDAGNGTIESYTECMEWFLAPYPQGADPSTGDPTKAPDVINNSWGCPSSEGCSANSLVTPIHNLAAAGIVFVASAGNDGPGCATIDAPPADDSGDTLSVGAYSHSSGAIASFSSRGPSVSDHAIGPDITAPGVNVRSSLPNSSYGSLSGTSMAGPHVVGAVALLLSTKPSLRGNVAAITKALTSTATAKTSTQSCAAADGGVVSGSSIPNDTWGFGILNVFKAASQ